MNENRFMKIPTLEGTQEWRNYLLYELAWVKWGMVWIVVSSVMLFIAYLTLFPFSYTLWKTFGNGSDVVRFGIVIFAMLFHIIGMICCRHCPETVVKGRDWHIGLSVLLFGIAVFVILWTLFQEYFFPNPNIYLAAMAAYFRMAIISSASLMLGLCIWLVFLLRLALGIHARKCVCLALAVLIFYILLPVVIIKNFTLMSNQYYTWIALLMFLPYLLLIISLWWRIRKILSEPQS